MPSSLASSGHRPTGLWSPSPADNWWHDWHRDTGMLSIVIPGRVLSYWHFREKWWKNAWKIICKSFDFLKLFSNCVSHANLKCEPGDDRNMEIFVAFSFSAKAADTATGRDRGARILSFKWRLWRLDDTQITNCTNKCPNAILKTQNIIATWKVMEVRATEVTLWYHVDIQWLIDLS